MVEGTLFKMKGTKMQGEKMWPEGVKMAATITINLDGEQFWKGMFPDSERRPKTLSMGDYGILRGLDRVLKALKDYGMQATFFVPGKIAENHGEALEKILREGHEVAAHGYTHRPMHLLSLPEQEEEIFKSSEALSRITGSRPLGFRVPEGEFSRETLDAVSRHGFLYSSSLYDDDRPYLHRDLSEPLVEIPMKWTLHDFPYFAFNYNPAFPSGQSRVAPYKSVLDNYLKELEAHRHYGLLYVPQFTPQIIGSPGRIGILESILAHLSCRENLWIGTCGELAAWTLKSRGEGDKNL